MGMLLLANVLVATAVGMQLHSGTDEYVNSSTEWWPWEFLFPSDSPAEIPAAETTIHLTMLTDRLDGAAAAFQSVCANAAEPGRLMFHIIGPSDSSAWDLKEMAPACAHGGAKAELYPLAEMTQRVMDAGFHPAWLMNWDITHTNVSVRPAAWDNSTIHNDPFNILRFYLPEIKPFKKMSKVLFMDDDIVLNGDVAKAWEYQLKDDAVMSASCHNWVWSECDRLTSSTDLSYLDVPYLGFGRLSKDRTADSALCQTEHERECIPEGFLEMLERESRRINGKQHQVTVDSMGRTKAWNYGFNQFDLNAWRKHEITKKYDRWIKLNQKHNLFPSTSLSYGLGIPMLAKLGHVQCFDDVTPVVQGLGFVGPKDMRGAGHYAQELERSFGMHFNGPRKPWDPLAGNPYSHLFLRYARDSMKEGFAKAVQALHARRKSRAVMNATSFVVLTDPKSGSEWFMNMLDQHSEICASGEKADGVEGFPRAALIPARFGHKAAGHTPKEAVAASARSSHPPVSMLSMKGAAEITVPKNYYTSGVPSINSQQTLPDSTNSSDTDNLFEAHRSLQALSEASHQKIGGINACQLKASCSWGFLANLVWHAAQEQEICAGHRSDWEARSQLYGLGDHLAVVCHLFRSARSTVLKTESDPTPTQIVQAAFQLFFHQQMRQSLWRSEADFGSRREARQLTPCKCPRTALITGQRIMHKWIGDVPLRRNAATDWKAHPADVNFNAELATKELGTPYYDLVGAMSELGTKVIMFHRENLLARFLSQQSANQNHCENSDCAEAASLPRVRIDVTELRKFIRWNRRMHERSSALLKKGGIQTLSITYEDCSENVAQCMDKVTEFLGVSAPTETLVSTTNSISLIKLRKQIINIDEVAAALDKDGNLDWLH